MSFEVEKFLHFHGRNYPRGVSLKTRKLPWLFIFHDTDSVSRVVLEAAITKGLRLVIGETAIIVSPTEASQLVSESFYSFAALVEVGGVQVLSLDDGSIFNFREIIPAVCVLELNETDESKKNFWKILKSLSDLVL